MNRVLTETGALERARWLGELAAAIDEAQRMAWRIAGDGVEIGELYSRLDWARAEVEALRRGGWADEFQELPPEWIKLLQPGAIPAHLGSFF